MTVGRPGLLCFASFLATFRNSPQGRVDKRSFSGNRRCADRHCEERSSPEMYGLFPDNA
ncbi:MAG: hypothetical protein LBL42_00545 [Tannerella sp.]|nr:hypothetical protein [Tannerella sp.]